MAEQKGIVLTAPGYLGHGAWRIVIGKKGVGEVIESYNYSALDKDHYIIFSYIEDKIDHAEEVICRNRVQNTEEVAKKRTKELAISRAPSFALARGLPFLGIINSEGKLEQLAQSEDSDFKSYRQAWSEGAISENFPTRGR